MIKTESKKSICLTKVFKMYFCFNENKNIEVFNISYFEIKSETLIKMF